MEIYWKRESIRKKVEAHAQSNRITARRMQSIKNAQSFCDLRPSSTGRAHFLDREYDGYFSIDLESKFNGRRLICIPRGDYKMDGDKYIEDTIVELEIVEVDDYHKSNKK